RLTAEGRDKFFHQVVVATPAYAAAALLRGLDRELAAGLERIRYSPIAVVGFGYEALDHRLEGFGLLTTTSAKVPVLGILWDSSVFPDRAPAGKKSLRVMIGGQRNPDLPARSDGELIELARRGIRETMGATADPAVTFVKRWPRGIPNYAVGHLDNRKAVFKRLDRWPGLWLNSNAYRGVSMNDCVHNSRRLVERMVQVAS
ncbi:MAG: protoporphyrinogen oxidase, partial [Pseudomonadota bacterium]